MSTRFPPNDESLLKKIVNAGYAAFTGPSGLFGGKNESRTVVVIHRGMGRRWEIVLREENNDILTATTTCLEDASQAVVSWLKNESIQSVSEMLEEDEGE